MSKLDFKTAKSRALGTGLGAAFLLSATPAMSATILVNSTTDSLVDGVNCTLRGAVMATNSNLQIGGCTAGDAGEDLINFAGSVAYPLTAGELSITESVRFNENGNTPTIDAANNQNNRIFNISGMATSVTLTNLNLQNGTVVGMGASGGAILAGAGSVLNITGGNINGNTSVRAGGAIETSGTSVTLTNVNFSGNDAGTAPGNGGVLHVTGSTTVNITGGTFDGNTAQEGGALWNNAGTMTITDATISNNTATCNGSGTNLGGGGIFNNAGNTSSDAGDGTGGTIVISGSDITGNRVPNGAGSGGGILNNNAGTIDITTSTISGNSAQRAGGGIETRGGTEMFIEVVALQGNTVANNPGNGGGLHVTGDGNVDIISSLVVNNTAGSEGGGLWNSTGTMNVFDVSVLSNTASGDGADNGGGGIFNDGGIVNVEGGRISGNLANGESGSGGGVFTNTGTTTNLSFIEISANSANRAGGGVENIGTTNLDNVILGGTDPSFGNMTGSNPGNGGGLHNGAGAVTVVDSSVGYNTATSEGGGLWNNDGSTLTVTNTTVSNNQADDEGGGLYQVSGGNSTFVNFSTVARNSAGNEGGGLAVGSTATAAFVVDSSIVAENTAGTNPDFDPAIATLSNSTGSDVDNALGTYRLFGDFTPTHPLQAGSAAIGAASTANCANVVDNADQRGAERPGNGTTACDAGAFEVTDDPVITVTNTNSTPVTVNPDSNNVVLLGIQLTNNGDESVNVGGFTGSVNINSVAIDAFVDNGDISLFLDNNNNGRLDSSDEVLDADFSLFNDFSFDVEFADGAGFAFASGDSASYLIVGNSTTTSAVANWVMPVYAGGTLLGLLGLFSVGGLRRRTRWILAIAVVTVGLTACGDGSPGSGAQAGNGPVQGDAQFVAQALLQGTGENGNFIIGDGMPVRGPALTASSN